MIRTVLTALILSAAPVAALAECFSDHQQAMSCADGKVWDQDSKSCIATTG
ncbi:hypothetical protein [Thalassovita sp.]|uniref:hypothetical protein n=1 Tax=Thalassovita sp. TaxID=1979401 RepID=UPI0029DE61FA|nr:hypothetical protein [Thalassovita sp.]